MKRYFFKIYISVPAEKVCFQCISLVRSEKTRFSWSFIHAGTTSQLAQLPTGTTSPWNNFPNHNFPLAQLPYSYNFPIHTTSLWHNLPLVQLPYGTTYPWDNFPMAQLTPGTTSLWHNLPLVQLPYGTTYPWHNLSWNNFPMAQVPMAQLPEADIHTCLSRGKSLQL